MPDGRSFEERVLARLDAIDGRLDSMDRRVDSVDGRLGSLESQAEQHARERKPIWERALAEFLK